MTNPEKIAHYEVLDLIGRGGMGAVFRARDTQLDRTVALKILTPTDLPGDEIKERFLREARAGAQLNHPGIVTIYEVGEDEGQHYIAMEYVQGRTLRQLLQEARPSPQEVIDIIVATGRALGAAHKQGIIHRDIKTDNVMVAEGGEVKVMDFGLAKMVDASVLTKEGEIMGTVAYMSPQQATGEPIDYRSDIFSLGVVLYELLTGQRPFSGDQEIAIVFSLLNEEPMGVRELNPEVPRELEQIVFKALQKEPQDRYDQVVQMVADLEKVRQALSGIGQVSLADLELVAAEVVAPEEREFRAQLVGREEKLASLRELLHQTTLGQGRTVLISGEAGIGKTRLVGELSNHAKTRKIRTLTGACVHRMKSYPYHPFVEAIQEYFQLKGVEGVQKLESFVEGKAPELKPQMSVLKVFLNLEGQESAQVVNREELLQSISKLIERAASERPLILFIDDLQWADEDTLSLLHYTARWIRRAKVLLVGTYRPEDLSVPGDEISNLLPRVRQEMNREGLLVELPLERLKGEDLHPMVDSLFPGAEFGGDFYRTLFDETEGNPLFVLETLKLMKAEGVILQENEHYTLRESPDRLAIPSKVHDVIKRRLQRLNEEEHDILELASVEGEAFNSATVAECLALNKIKVLKTLQRLEREHHVIHAAEKRYRFDHAKIRDLLYQDILPELRQEYHMLVGSYLRSNFSQDEQVIPQIAHHLLEADDPEGALPFLIKAAERAKRVFANAEAIELFTRAGEIAGEITWEDEARKTETLAAVGEHLGDIFVLTGRHQEAVEAYAGALGLAGLPGERCSCLMRKTSSVREKQGGFEQALESLHKAQECVEPLAGQDEGRRELGRIWIERGAVHYKMGEAEKAEEEIRRGLELLEGSGASADLAAGYHYLGIVYRSRGDYDTAVEMHTASLKLREQIGDRWGIALSFNNLGIAYKNQGKKDLAIEMYQRCLEIFEQIGYRLGVAGLLNNLGSLAQDKGDYPRAREMFQRSLEIRQGIGNRHGVAMSLTNLGLVCLECGEHDQAREILQESLALQKELGLGDFESITCSYLAQVCCRLDRFERASELADEAVALAVASKQRGNEGLARRVWGEVRTRQAATADGEKRTELIQGAGLELERSQEIFQELGMEQEIGRTLLDMARLHQVAKHRDEARESALKARDIFQKLDAQGDLRQAEEILESLSGGHRPPNGAAIT
jgi:tetratricopeptide (TPR) repeat protein/predicted Ser/Thr protein kinase